MKKQLTAALLAFCVGCGALTTIQASAEPTNGSVTFGDVDADGSVNAKDAAVILSASARFGATGNYGLTSEEVSAADIDRNGSVNAKDASWILQYAAAVGTGYTNALELYLYEKQNPAETETLTNPPMPTDLIPAAKPTEATTYAAPTEPPTYIVPTQPTSPPPVVPDQDDSFEAVFLGVSNWGASSTTFSNASNFTYRFLVNGSEQIYTVSNAMTEDMPYPIQNRLKVNYHFRLRTVGNQIVSVQEIEDDFPFYDPPVSGTPGVLTLRNLLTTAMEPVGTTLYMFGGGWNWQDDGSGWQTRSIGVQPDWVRFWQEHDQSYTYRTNNHTTTYYPYGEFNQYYYAGLDCSGFVSWAVYNTLHSENGLPGYGGKSTQMARRFAGYGWGQWTHSVTTSTVMRPGDIMSMNGHVWLSLGTCADGSIVIAHSTPSNSHSGQPGGGVQIGAVGNSTSCQAYKLASKYMQRFYPEWCSRYKVTLKTKSDYLAVKAADAGRFTWNCTYPLTDPDGIQNMSADQALYYIFGE
ncbi:MAG: dockerin type I repeat-containing protein [Oscillospiraceae bacterium]|nr:dockerin type I repeat-containing protein [Oscillospiraceae bacterium]